MNPRLKMRGYGGAAVVVLTATVAWLMVQVPTLQDKAEEASVKADRLEPQVQSLNDNQQKLISGLDEANRRLVALGKAPVPVPSVTPSQPSGLTAADVRLVVTQELADQNITVTQAEVSQIARTVNSLKTSMPTQINTSVKLAVAAYCLEDRCVGKPGTPGQPGKQGEPGKDAPKVTDEELLRAAQQALLSYCGQESQPCKGEAGPTGPAGSQGDSGPAGRGITDTDCLEDGTWRISYSDGTTQIVRGPCRVGVVPPAEKATN